MTNWQEMIVEALIGLVIYLIGVRSIRRVFSNIIRKKWGDIALQVLVFFFLILAFLFFQLPLLQQFSLLGVVFAALTITAMASLVNEHASLYSDLKVWFGEDADRILSYLPNDSSINQKVLKRMASILHSRGQVHTKTMVYSVKVTQCISEGRFLLYDVTDTFSYNLSSSPIEVDLILDIRPTWLKPIPYNANFPALPLEFHSPQDKWHISIWPVMSIDDISFWESWIDNISVDCWQLDESGKIQSKVIFNREVFQFEDILDEREINSKRVLFSARIKLSKNLPMLTIHTRNIPHPTTIPDLYTFAWDLCEGIWDYQISVEDLYPKVKIANLIPLTTIGEVAIPSLQVRHSYANIRMEAMNGSVILPQDAVLIRLKLND